MELLCCVEVEVEVEVEEELLPVPLRLAWAKASPEGRTSAAESVAAARILIICFIAVKFF